MRKSVIAALGLLSVLAACERHPDEQARSGLRIYIYRLDDGKQLWLRSP